MVAQLVCFYYVLTTFTTVGYGKYTILPWTLNSIVSGFNPITSQEIFLHRIEMSWSVVFEKNRSSLACIVIECEQVYCLFLFLCAASLFGTIIAQVNEIVAHLTTKKKDLDEIFESYLSVRPRSVDYCFPPSQSAMLRSRPAAQGRIDLT